jgi:hypothetical protein
VILLKSAATFGFMLLASTAFADDLVPYSTAGGWDVMVDTTLGNGCFLTSEYEDGSTVRIGFDRTAGNGYVAAYNQGWGEIEDDKAYPITFMLDDQKYDGEAHGMHLDEVPGVWITFDSIDFLADLAARTTMTLQHDGTDVMSIDLSGSDQAITETIACQEAQEG